MSNEIQALFESSKFAEDGRFLQKEDAVYFYMEYFNSPEYILTGISTKKKYMELLPEGNTADKISGSCLGYDIIGWDSGSYNFHSFLCNRLNKKFSGLRFNSCGLLDEQFSAVEKMALSIHGMGEPVSWFPVAVHKIDTERKDKIK